uniref:Uncharacterized protein n=1 Tax=Hyaloperonospora arabidopsidis (strain Emoy2) TaxID=559515 RepID=M4BU37_HYAAE
MACPWLLEFARDNSPYEFVPRVPVSITLLTTTKIRICADGTTTFLLLSLLHKARKS